MSLTSTEPARSGAGVGGGNALIELVAVEKTYRMGRLDYPALRASTSRSGPGSWSRSWVRRAVARRRF
jgi:hypothetical protein